MQFFKNYLASLLAVLTGILIFVPLSILILTGWLASLGDPEEVRVKENSVLHLKLNQQVVENAEGSGINLPIDQYLPIPGMVSTAQIGLFQIVETLDLAAQDDQISGIYLNLQGSVLAGWVSLKAIRDALLAFKSTGKFIYAYSEIYDERAYYLASVADVVSMPEIGALELNGLAASPYFLAGLFEKLGIEPKVFKVGTFKSAIEPYILKQMSEASRLQTEAYLQDIWSVFEEEVATSRQLAPGQIDTIAAEFIFGGGKKALDLGLIDQVAYEEEVLNQIKEKMGLEADEEIERIGFNRYRQSNLLLPKTGKQQIAIVFAEGTINSGKSSDGIAGSASIVKALREARENEEVKAIVLRVNSPGGSIIASDMIAREVALCKAAKPTVVSMGDLAASGGYYISVNADHIFAQANTLTGSIGIFGILWEADQFLNEQLGITFDEVQTHPYANIGNPGLPWEEAEEAFMQRYTEQGYSQFLDIVMKGRGFTDSLALDQIAQGRVWSGAQALKLKLVDAQGDLQDAIVYAAEKAGLEGDYQLLRLPKSRSPLEEIFGSMVNAPLSGLSQTLPIEAMQQFRELQQRIPKNGLYALMPFYLDIR